MKKIGYRRVIHSNLRRFLLRADDYADKVGIRLTRGSYENEAKYWAITEAMAVWDALNPDGKFYQRLGERLSKLKGFDTRQYYAARDAQVRDLLSRLSSIEERSENAWVRAVCRFMLLPKDVARKWLWHENVDFQSCESFLRRLTNEQHVSLNLHYDLVKGGTETSKLPCFTDGAPNKVWNFFGLTAKEESNRMATKSAVVHDFFGFGMGFALYPNAIDDSATKKNLATQFLSKNHRGDFEVNKEHGGLYWFLYRTLRSNSLYREGKNVELGSWICPGFWFTMIMWGILTLVSPASLLVATCLYVLKGTVSWGLFGLGAILPIVVTLVWVKKLCNKEYDDEYWKWLMVVTGCYLVIILGHEILLHAKDYWSAPAGTLCIFLLVPYCIKKDTLDFWNAPILGKLLPLVFLSAGVWDIHVHSDFWQDGVNFFMWLAQSVWSLIQSVAYYLYEARAMIMWGTIGVAFYAAFLVSLFYFGTWVTKKVDTMVEQGDHNAYSYAGWAMLGVLFVFIVVAMLSASSSLSQSIRGGKLLAALMLINLPFLVFFATRGMNRVSVVVNNKVLRGALKYHTMGEENRSFVRAAISCNKFWVDITHAVARANVLNDILYKVQSHYGSRFVWVIAMIRSVKDDAELSNVQKFASSELYRELSFGEDGVDQDVLRLILSGANEEDIGQAIKSAREKYFSISRKQTEPSTGEKFADWLVEWLNNRALPFFIKCFMFVTWPIRMLWKGICDLYDLWEAFNEQCPQAPPRDRPVAQ